MYESVYLEFLGIENDEERLKIKFDGFDTEIRINMLSHEETFIITDEIAKHFGCESADELLNSDGYLDYLNKIKKETGAFPRIKFRCKDHISQEPGQTTIAKIDEDGHR